MRVSFVVLHARAGRTYLHPHRRIEVDASPDNCDDNDITSRYDAIMAATSNRPAPRFSLNLRIKPELRGLIDRAAQLMGKNRTDFVLEAARRAAEDALLDRTLFTVSPTAYAEFLARLDAPPQPNERLHRTMRTPSPWDEA
jgi:uncharacterized protein (DUF1778 family)